MLLPRARDLDRYRQALDRVALVQAVLLIAAVVLALPFALNSMVTQLTGDLVTLDGNHPLAGQNLNFEVEVAEVRAATAEELQHGHAHGPGDHHH